MRLSRYALAIVFLLSLFIQACGGPRYGAPVDSRSQPPSIKIGYHIVSKGETLYSIAWRYGLDYKELARVNGISTTNYAIYPGQKLSLNTRAATRKPAYTAPPRTTTKTGSSPTKSVSSKSTSTKSVARNTAVDSSRSKPAASSKSTGSAVKPVAKPVTQTSAVSSGGSVKWQWPAKGVVTKAFSGATSTNKGIDIKGREGDPVYAAASGKVVYAGSGLAGYGKLIIIKHNENYLSAYAHNRKLLVGEGDQVERGKKIGEIGSNNGQTILHFEIRLNGKPVNPQSYLPR